MGFKLQIHSKKQMRETHQNALVIVWFKMRYYYYNYSFKFQLTDSPLALCVGYLRVSISLSSSDLETHPSIPHANDRDVLSSIFIPPTTESGGLLISAPALVANKNNPIPLDSLGSFIMPVTPEADLEMSLSYLPSVDPEFFTLSDFGLQIEGQCHGEENNSWLHLQGNSISEAADGLVKAIKSVNQSHLDMFNTSSIIQPLGLSLGKMFSVPHWMFRA